MRQNSQYVEIGDKCNKASMRSLKKGTHNVMERGHTTGLAKWLRRATERAQEGKSRRCGGQAFALSTRFPPADNHRKFNLILYCVVSFLLLPPPHAKDPGGRRTLASILSHKV